MEKPQIKATYQVIIPTDGGFTWKMPVQHQHLCACKFLGAWLKPPSAFLKFANYWSNLLNFIAYFGVFPLARIVNREL